MAKENSTHIFTLTFCAVLAIASARAEPADLLLVHGNIYTENPAQPRAEAIASRGQRVCFVGTDEQAKEISARRTIELHGATVVPGLTDSHCHIFGIGERELTLNLAGTNSREDFLAKVKEKIAQTPQGAWVTGRGWIETFWKPPQFPTRQDLDAIAPDNPVYLTRTDGHASVANSAALKAAGVDERTPDPFGGRILKTDGKPNGMLLDNAQDLVEKKIPGPTEEERERAFRTGIDHEIRLGWCEIQNAGSHYSDIAIMKKAFAAGAIKLRFINCVYGPEIGRAHV